MFHKHMDPTDPDRIHHYLYGSGSFHYQEVPDPGGSKTMDPTDPDPKQCLKQIAKWFNIPVPDPVRLY
jgi:hypothetical protein